MFFGVLTTNCTFQIISAALRVKEDYVLNYDQVREISSATSLNLRVKAIKELAEVARAHRLEEVSVSPSYTVKLASC